MLSQKELVGEFEEGDPHHRDDDEELRLEYISVGSGTHQDMFESVERYHSVEEEKAPNVPQTKVLAQVPQVFETSKQRYRIKKQMRDGRFLHNTLAAPLSCYVT